MISTMICQKSNAGGRIKGGNISLFADMDRVDDAFDDASDPIRLVDEHFKVLFYFYLFMLYFHHST